MSDAVRVQIEQLEQSEVAAILAGNTDQLRDLWHPDYLVNAPHNQLTRSSVEVLDLVIAGVIAYSSFARTVEGIAVHGDTVVVMGSETVSPRYGPQAGETLTRRYSNVWQKTGDDWRMIARHASVVSGPGQNLDHHRA